MCPVASESGLQLDFTCPLTAFVAGNGNSTPACTSRGLKEPDFVKVAAFIHEGVRIAQEMSASSGHKLKDFKLNKEHPGLKDLAHEVKQFAKKFPMPGF